jgi:hypothetical protein
MQNKTARYTSLQNNGNKIYRTRRHYFIDRKNVEQVYILSATFFSLIFWLNYYINKNVIYESTIQYLL